MPIYQPYVDSNKFLWLVKAANEKEALKKAKEGWFVFHPQFKDNPILLQTIDFSALKVKEVEFENGISTHLN